MRESLLLAFSQIHYHKSLLYRQTKIPSDEFNHCNCQLALLPETDPTFPLHPPSSSRMSAKCHALWVDDRRSSPPCTDRRRTTDGMNGLSAIQSFHPTLLAFESARMARHSRFRRTDGRRKCERLFTNYRARLKGGS